MTLSLRYVEGIEASDDVKVQKGKTFTLTPDYEYSIPDFKKRPRLYPNHMLYDVYDLGVTVNGWTSGANSEIISITKSDGQKYTAGMATGTVTVKGIKKGTTTLVCRAPNGTC